MEMNAANVGQHKIFSISFRRPEVTSLSGRFLDFNINLAKPKVENLIKQFSIPFALVGYEIGYSQLVPTGLVGYLPSHIQRALME